MGEARDFLKRTTAERHRRLDDNPLVLGLAAGTLGGKVYAGMLGAYRNFFGSWEREFKRDHAELVRELGSFRFEKTAWLDEDLQRLGATRGNNVGFTAPSVPSARAETAGCLYVIEGSTLGGLHLSRRGTFPAGAGRFFAGYGERTVPAWQAFLQWLEQALPDEASRQAAAGAALATFDWFQHGFDELAKGASSP